MRFSARPRSIAVLLGLILAALVLLTTAPDAGYAKSGFNSPTHGQVYRQPAGQVTPEPIETPTPLPTLADTDSGGTPGSAVLVGIMLICVMGLMLAAGVGAAILFVRLRNKLG